MPLSLTEQFLLKLDAFAQKYGQRHTLNEMLSGYHWVDYEKIDKTWPNKDARQKYYFAMKNLKKGGYLEENRKNEKFLLKLTPKGILRLMRTKIKAHKFKVDNKAKWDGKWRVVIFDIPERRRKLRDALRGLLYELDFIKLQNSVWISPYDALREIREFAENCSLLPFVQIMLVENIDNEKHLIKYFFKNSSFRNKKT